MVRLLPRRGQAFAETVESQLVRRAQAGDGDAFRALFNRHVSAVRRFLSDVLREKAAADEATQETFVRAHALLHKLADAGRFRFWLLGIARNVGFEELRRKKGDEPLDDDGEALEAVIPSPDPESLLLDRELEGLFTEALGTLSAPRRAVLSLRLDHGLPYDEIASMMNWSLQQVKNEIHRARLQLRAQLLPHLGGGR